MSKWNNDNNRSDKDLTENNYLPSSSQGGEDDRYIPIDNDFIKGQISFYNQVLMSGLLAQKEREKVELWCNAMINSESDFLAYEANDRKQYYSSLLDRSAEVLTMYTRGVANKCRLESANSDFQTLMQISQAADDQIKRATQSNLNEQVKKTLIEAIQSTLDKYKDLIMG